MSYQSVVLGDSPTYYYRLNEGAGTTAADSADSNPATYQAGGHVSLGQLGLPGTGDSSISVDGNSAGNVFQGSSSTLMSPPLSVEIWSKTAFGGGAVMASFQSDQTGTSSVSYNCLVYYDSGMVPRFDANDGSHHSVIGPTATNDNLWHHYVGTISAGGTVRLYVDGLSVGTPVTIGTLTTFTGFWRCGAGNSTGIPNGGGLSNVTGNLSEFAIYSLALNPQQTLAHYRLGANVISGRPQPPVLGTFVRRAAFY